MGGQAIKEGFLRKEVTFTHGLKGGGRRHLAEEGRPSLGSKAQSKQLESKKGGERGGGWRGMVA